MGNVLIRDVPQRVLESLKERAATHHRSLQQELVAILKEAAEDQVDRLVQQIREQRARYEKAGKHISDSTCLIRKDRKR